MVEKIVGNAMKQLRPEFDKENYDKVIELSNKILNYQSNNTVALFFRASSRLRKKLYTESETDFKEVINCPELDKNLLLNSYRGLATLYEESDDFDNYLITMKSILELKIK